MRSTRWWWRSCGALVTVFAFVVSAAAQISPSSPSIMNGAGENARHGPLAFLPFESVDPLNGGLHLTQTDLVLPGNAGFDLAITRVYNSKIFPDWEAGGGQSLMDPSWVGLGWRLHLGRVVRLQDGNPGVTAIEMPDGSEHPLWNTPDVPEGWITSEYWRFNRATRTLTLPNGLVYTFGWRVPRRIAWGRSGTSPTSAIRSATVSRSPTSARARGRPTASKRSASISATARSAR